jgi:hypothetical protein
MFFLYTIFGTSFRHLPYFIDDDIIGIARILEPHVRTDVVPAGSGWCEKSAPRGHRVQRYRTVQEVYCWLWYVKFLLLGVIFLNNHTVEYRGKEE